MILDEAKGKASKIGVAMVIATVIAALVFAVIAAKDLGSFTTIFGILIFPLIFVGFGLYASLMSFITSLFVHINPYTTYVDKSNSLAAQSGIKRNYFFGPGYHQIAVTIRDAVTFLKKQPEDMKSLKGGNDIFEILIGYVLYGVAVFSTFVFGFAWIAVFSVLMLAVIIPGMCIFYVLFLFPWGADRLILLFKSVQSRCPNDKRISIVPVFICPGCGMEHKKLTPGPYGIFSRECSCGKRLSTTIFNGRSRYKAVCPFCGSGLAASDARQFGIQLVGGISTGKTTFLAAFWHEYLDRLKKVRGVSIVVSPKDAFTELEYWFQNGGSSSTAETNANMYSVIYRKGKKTPIQMTVYDIAGEAFASLANGIQQRQFQYCEGIVFIIDPTAPPAHVSGTVSGFIHELEGLKGSHSMKTSDVPVAVLIAKADLYKREIGLPKIKTIYNSNAQTYADAKGNTSMELVRNGVCRAFLGSHGFSNAMNLIDAEFNKVQYYPVSAMGHPSAVGQKYEPWGVLEPIVWLLQQQGAVFQDIVSWL